MLMFILEGVWVIIYSMLDRGRRDGGGVIDVVGGGCVVVWLGGCVVDVVDKLAYYHTIGCISFLSSSIAGPYANLSLAPSYGIAI